MKLGFLYAGQGSQHAGMGADLYEAFSAFRAVYDHAEVDFDFCVVTSGICVIYSDGLAIRGYKLYQ